MRIKQLSRFLVICCLLVSLVTMSFLTSCCTTNVGQDATYTMGITDSFPKSKNPFAPAISETDYNALVQVYEPLLVHTNNRGTPIPLLAESWDYDAATTSYTFHLNKKAKFSDGTQVTATDVKYSWDTMLDVVGKWPTAKGMIEEIVVVDTTTVKFVLNDKYAGFLTEIGNVFIVPQHVWAEVGDILTYTNTDPVGSGPYLWTEYVTDSHCIYERNPYYWGGATGVARVIHKYYGTAESMLLAYKKGDLDAMEGVTIESSIPSLLLDPDIEVLISPGAGTWALELNLRNEPFNNLAFRQALNMAIDRQAMIDTVLNGYGVIPQMTSVPPSNADCNPDAKWEYEFNTQAERIDLANAKLDSISGMSTTPDPIPAGWGRTFDGDPLVVEFYHSSYSKTAALSQVILDSLLDVGIKCNVHAQSYSTAYGAVHRHQGDPAKVAAWDMFYVWAPDFYVQWAQPAPASLASGGTWRDNLFESEASGWTNAAIQAKMTAQATEMDPETRSALQMEIQELFAAELPMVPLYHTSRASTYRTNRFTGWIDQTDIYYGDGIDYGGTNISFVATPFTTLNLEAI